MSDGKPCILFVDDSPENLGPLASLVRDLGAEVPAPLHPMDITEDDLRRADLMVVDWELTEWPSRDNQSELSLKPNNGLALISVLREQARRLEEDFNGDSETVRPTGFALLTGKPEDFQHDPQLRKPHVISKLENLEWFFRKSDINERNIAEFNPRKIYSLGLGIRSLQEKLGRKETTIPALVRFLGMSDDDLLFERYCDAVLSCRPPIRQTYVWDQRMSVIRWLLHRILPHTAFLFDRIALAVRLHVKLDWLDAQLEKGNALATELSKLKYSGPFSDFDSTRWWRDGVEQWLWDETNGQSADSEAVIELIGGVAGEDVDTLEMQRPFVALTPTLERDENPAEFDDLIRLNLDDWPDYAEPPLFRQSDLKAHPELEPYVAR